MRKTILIAILLFILASCRGYIERPSDTQDITTWAEFFDLWWNKMDQDYVFWSFDSPADEWDQVRKDAVPKMESYGSLTEGNTKDAARLLFDLTKNLTDGHFQMEFDSSFGISSFSPLLYRKMREAGLSDEESFELRYTPDTDLRLWNESDFIAENTKSIMQETFKIAIADESNINQPYTTTNEIYDGRFEKAGYVAYSSVQFQDVPTIGIPVAPISVDRKRMPMYPPAPANNLHMPKSADTRRVSGISKKCSTFLKSNTVSLFRMFSRPYDLPMYLTPDDMPTMSLNRYSSGTAISKACPSLKFVPFRTAPL